MKILIQSLTILFIASGLITVANAEPMSVTEETFSIPTKDKLTTINGTISLPTTHASGQLIPIVIVGGSLASRDGATYVRTDENHPEDSNRNDKFWYRIIAHQLTQAGFAVIRYDSRGLASVLECEKQSTHQLAPAEYLSGHPTCYDESAVLTTTFKNKKEDIQSVVEMVKEDSRMAYKRLIIIAHSEGVFHVSTLISKKLINPASLIFLGAPLNSPKQSSILQDVDWPLKWIEKHIKLNGGVISLDELKQFAISEYQIIRFPEFYENWTHWTIADMPGLKMRFMEKFKGDTIFFSKLSQQAPIVGNLDDKTIRGVTIGTASYALSLSADDTKVLDSLHHYHGPLTFIFGKNDFIVPVTKGIEMIHKDKYLSHRATIIEIDNINHNFFLPNQHINHDAVDVLVKEALRVSQMKNN